MESKESEEKLIEYLYGEIPPHEKPSFKKQLENNPHLKGELLQFLQLRQMVSEHLPEKKAPSHLTRKVLSELGVRRPWYEFFTTGFLRPALTGAFVVVLTFGVAYQVQRMGQPTQTVARNDVSLRAPWVPSHSGPDYRDMLLTNRPVQPQLRVSPRRFSPGFGNSLAGGRVSLVGVGSPNISPPQVSAGIPEPEIEKLEIEAQLAVGQFMHQQALRMRAMGQFKGAAEQLADLIKTYPFYPLKLEAMAQRIDCLFKAGEERVAREELKVLRNLSPNLAFLVERRWGE